MNTTTDKRRYALLIGISLVVMTIVAGGVFGGIYEPILKLTPNEFADAFDDFKGKQLIGLIGWGIILITDLLVSWGLYRYYQDKKPSRALIMGLLRLVYSIILGIAIFQLLRAEQESDPNVVFNHLLSFQNIWQLGLFVFGLHLLALSPLVCGKHWVKKVLSFFLLMAGIGYVLSNTLNFVIVDYDQIRASVELMFIPSMILGELGLAIWLLVKGGKAS